MRFAPPPTQISNLKAKLMTDSFEDRFTPELREAVINFNVSSLIGEMSNDVKGMITELASLFDQGHEVVVPKSVVMGVLEEIVTYTFHVVEINNIITKPLLKPMNDFKAEYGDSAISEMAEYIKEEVIKDPRLKEAEKVANESPENLKVRLQKNMEERLAKGFTDFLKENSSE